jgi:hypothetical protein
VVLWEESVWLVFREGRVCGGENKVCPSRSSAPRSDSVRERSEGDRLALPLASSGPSGIGEVGRCTLFLAMYFMMTLRFALHSSMRSSPCVPRCALSCSLTALAAPKNVPAISAERPRKPMMLQACALGAVGSSPRVKVKSCICTLATNAP